MRTMLKWCALLAIVLGMVAVAQIISGDLVGTVTDKTGATVPNATVELVNNGTAIKTTAVTNDRGEYRFTNLPVGSYTLTASAKGFAKTTIRNLGVELNKTATANVVLQVGAVEATIEVTEAGAMIDTTTAQVQTTYQLKEAQDLPSASVGLGVLNLSLLQAGVASTGGLGAGTGPAIGGQRPRNNNFEVEGVDNNDKGVTGPLIYIPNDAVSNFTVMQNQFSPEFGHSTGGQFNTVVVSGTNNFHGRVYEYFQNRNLNAIDYSVANQTPAGEKPKNPRYDNNRFGGQLGGPILKNKLFFFGSFEYQPIGRAAVPGSPILAPTAAGYTALLNAPGLSTQNINGLRQYAQAPAPCSAADIAARICPAGGVLPVTGVTGGVEVGVLPIVAPNYSNFKALTTSLDYNLSDKDQIRGRYIYNKSSFIDTAAQLPVFYTTVPTFYHLFALNEYHTFNSFLTNELRLGYNRTGYNYGVPDIKFGNLDAFPNLTIDNLGGLNVGPDPNAPQYATQNLYQIVNNLSWIKGAHTFKFGVEGRKWISPQLFIQRSRGDYEWGTLDAYVRDLVPGFAERSIGSVGYSGDQSAFYWFVNDTWKVLPNFSVNLGVRYEYTGVPYGWTQQKLNAIANVPGLITFDSPRAPKTNFMPRVGFAWSPGTSGNTSVRGGFGMGYDVLYDNIGTLSRPPQIGSTTDCPGGAGCPTSNFLASGGIPPGGATGITTYDAATARALTSSFLPNDVKYPYSMQWNLGVQHVFKSNYTAEVRYVGTRGVHLNVQNRLNVIPMITPSNQLPTFLQRPSQATLDSLTTTLDSLLPLYDPDPRTCVGLACVPAYIDPRWRDAGFTNPIVGFMPWGGSVYHGLQTQLNRRLANGLQFQFAYTWSHAIDDSTADFFSTVLTPRRPEDFRNLHAERSNSAIDRRHRLTISAIYDLPWFKSGSWMAKNFLGNWEFAPVYTYETGEWATIQSGSTDSNMNGDTAGDRAILNPAGRPGTGSGVTELTNSAGEVVAYLANDPTARYIVAGTGTLPNVGRNTLLMRPINNWDLTLLKRINATERYHVEMAAQLLNAFNHPQFIAGSLNQINSISRVEGAQRNYLVPNKTNFNEPRISWPSNARTMQLYVKFIF